MLNVIIADDEFYARKALIKKVKSLGLKLQVVKEAENGKQVAAFLEEHREEYFLLLTDVRMPEMDGLELSAYLGARDLRVDVVIVSGYTDFSYAQKAIAYGVKNYLTKPVKLEELKETLEKIAASRKKREDFIKKEVTYQVQLKGLSHLSLEEILLNQEKKEKFLMPVFRKFAEMEYRLVLLQAMPRLKGEEKESFELDLEAVAASSNGCWFYFKRCEEYVFFVFSRKEKEEAAREAEFWRRFVKKKKIQGKALLSAGLSQRHQSLEQVKKAYQEAVYAINQRLVKGFDVYEFNGEIHPENKLTKEAEGLLLKAIENQWEDKAGTLLRELLFQCEDSYTLYVTIIGIFNLLYRIYCDRNPKQEKESSYLLFSFKSDLYGFYSMEEVEEYVVRIVKEMCQGQEGKKHHAIIDEVLYYIEKNYQENISLGELAEHKYFMNSSYLSRLFKQETGKTFSRYLMEFRMQRAAEYLEEGDIKINDVAGLCGYNDVSHFIQYFKKQYGCTPEEYKKPDR